MSEEMQKQPASESFEASMQRIEKIVRTLEKGDVQLEEALRLFEEGTGLVKRCSAQLEQAELQVVQLTKQPDGLPAEEVFTCE